MEGRKRKSVLLVRESGFVQPGEQGAFGGVADRRRLAAFLLLQVRCGIHGGVQRDQIDGPGMTIRWRNPAWGSFVESLPVPPEPHDLHAVLRQSAGLVGAD